MADRFRSLRSTATYDLMLRADGPILVKGPDAAAPERPDMSFVRYPTRWGEAPFIPGSSLKGVLRSGTEALLRGHGVDVCDPFDARSRCREDERDRCAACLLFGSTLGAGHVLVDDFLPWAPGDDEPRRRGRLELVNRRRVVRSGVAIDRQQGTAAPGRLFDYEVLVDVSFWGRITLRDPQPWHLPAVAAGLTLLDEGLLRIGSGTTRGLGRVRVVEQGLSLRAARPEDLDPLAAGAQLSAPRREGLWWVADAGPDTIRSLASRLSEMARGIGVGGR